jgi:PBP1b-binding outer membrane lipoprotein LpoB
MKKFLLLASVALFFNACSNEAKTEEQEQKERDSIDQVQLEKNQHMVDSIMQEAEMKDDSLSTTDSSAQ